jgi:hypothetical protein
MEYMSHKVTAGVLIQKIIYYYDNTHLKLPLFTLIYLQKYFKIASYIKDKRSSP